MTTSRPPIASATSNLFSNSRVDGERQRLRHALEAAGEHDRRAELAEAARERERRSRGETACARAASRSATNVRAGLAPSVRDASTSDLVDRLEGGDRLADVQRARDEGDGEDDRGLRERDLEPERLECRTEQADASERGEQPDTGNRGRQHERQLHQRDRQRAARETAAWQGGTRSACRRARISACAISGRLEADDERVRDDAGRRAGRRASTSGTRVKMAISGRRRNAPEISAAATQTDREQGLPRRIRYPPV